MVTIIQSNNNGSDNSFKFPTIEKDIIDSWLVVGRYIIEEKKVITIDTLLDFDADFKEFLVEKKKSYSVYPRTQYNNGYHYAYNNGSNVMKTSSDNRTCYFYEHSDLTKTAKIFFTISEFVKWAKEVGVYVSDYITDIMKENPCNYITCYYGKNYIMVRSTYTDLKKAHEEDVSRQKASDSYRDSHQNLPAVVCGAPSNPNTAINGPLARDFTNDGYPRDYDINGRWPYDD